MTIIIMSKRKQVKRRNRPSQKVYGAKAHRWPEKMLPFPSAAACIQLVLDNSGKAKTIYYEAVKTWSLPDCQQSLSEVKITFPMILAAIEAVEKNNFSGWKDPFGETCERYRKSDDFKHLIKIINQFILVGFNREADQAQGIYKVKPSDKFWLFYTVFLKTFVDYGASNPNFEQNKIVEFGNLLLDTSTFMDGTHTNRIHRKRAKLLKQQGWKLRNDEKLITIAKHWYQSRIVFAGPTEFCSSTDSTSEETLDPNEIDKEISICDEAVGYPRGGKRKLSEFQANIKLSLKKIISIIFRHLIDRIKGKMKRH
jgi:hypothetical protein